jgi:crotonobetainyl-CoA:carnitine CoA-transferase CaiB-like acyl-CoA transferase
MGNGPFNGIRVLDMTQVLAGPYTGQLLGDLGADVIKIEQPGTGDPSHKFVPYINGESAYFLGFNRNKKSLTLNLKTEDGLNIFYKLLETADVVLENYRPSVPPKLKIDYETLSRRKPDIVYCSISGFGHGTTNQNKPAMDTNIQALSGAMSVIGVDGQPPFTMGFPVGDVAAAYAALSGIGAALFERERTGKGKWIDISLLDVMVTLQAYIGQSYLVTGKEPGRLGSGHPTNTPVGSFETKDGEYVQIQCVTQPLFKKLCKIIEEMVPSKKGLSEDKRFATPADCLKNRSELMQIIADVIKEHTCEEWLTRASDEIAICHVNSIGEALSESSLLERNMIIEMKHPVAGQYKTIGNPIKLGQEESFSAPPTIGQNNDELLASLGYTKEDVKSFRDKGVI